MKSFSIKKNIKWFLIILLALFVIAGAGLTYFYTTAFKLVPWEYKSKEVSGNNLPERPNILFLVAEDMNSRAGAFGDLLAQTPNIDKLASQGIRYTNVFTTAGVCAPSRAGLITGMNQISMAGQHMRTGGRPEGGYYSVPPSDTKAMREDIARFYNNINAMDAVVGNILERLEKDGLAESTIVVWTTDPGDCLPRAKRDLTVSGLKVPMVIYYFRRKYS